MFQLEKLGRLVSRKIKTHGKEYFERNAVRIIFADIEFISAQVRGSRDYEVDLEREGRSLLYSCDCPLYEESLAVCKHIWATLLKMEQQGHLNKWNLRFPIELIPATNITFTEELVDDLDFEDEGTLDYKNGKTTQSIKTKFIPPVLPSWHNLMDSLNLGIGNVNKPPAWPDIREIIYILEQTKRSVSKNLSLRIEYREPKKNGGWKRQKPIQLSHELVACFPNPEDRQIIARLLGVKRETWFYSRYDQEYRFEPADHDLITLLPLMSGTGRLFFRIIETDELRQVQWDETGPWEFRIDVQKDPHGQQYEINGVFVKNGEQISVSAPHYVFMEGIFVKDAIIASFSGSYDWISLFRQEGAFFVPAKEGDQWLERMFKLPAIPAMNLPEEFRLEEVEAIPCPIAHVSTKQETWGAPYLHGEIFFDYLGHVVNEFEPTQIIPIIAQRQKITRKYDLENLARRQFVEAGFKKQEDFSGREIWKISQSRLPGAVRNLVSEGWQVRAEGKLFRNPNSFKIHIASGIDWFEMHGVVEFGETQVAIPRLLTAIRRHEKTILLDDGSLGMLPEEWMQKYGILAGMGTAKDDHVRFGRNQAGLLDALLASEQEVICDELFDRIRRELRMFSGIVPVDPAPGFRGQLRAYQREGLGWMHFLQQFGFGGCLADDMGLGKTVQVLALLEERRMLRRENGSNVRPAPSLVVMPRSLVFNWRQEAERFTPELRILEHTGAERIRGHEHFDDYDVVFTTYGTLRRDALFFKEKTFDYLILDEAQAIKNASTESAKAARLLHGKYRLALSGTPIENHLGELWSLFEFLNPGMLGSASVFKLGKESLVKNDEQTRLLLALALRPFILRRTKSQVAPELPVKVEQTLYCSLDPAQRTLYNELRDHYRKKLLDHIDREGINKAKIQILEALLRLRQAAIHPGLIDRTRINESSAKMDMLMPQLIEVLEEGHKALVFSQFTSMLSILRKKLEEGKIPYAYLDGQTRDRAAPVEQFQNDPECKLFLISLKAGGLGLNLTAAEYVFLLDPWWNPAVEAQAIDRTHRIGQTRSVFAYRLIARDTVEEKVLELQKTKRDIADAIINQDNSILTNLRSEDLAMLLS
jgi:superfamily II DNA or RNA helicase